jgi:hypothetical protein
MSQQIGNESNEVISKEVIKIDSNIMRMEGPYESANRQFRLMARTEGYTKTQSKKKVAGNSFYTTTFMYEIRHLDPLTQTLLLSYYSEHYFSPYITQICSEL